MPPSLMEGIRVPKESGTFACLGPAERLFAPAEPDLRQTRASLAQLLTDLENARNERPSAQRRVGRRGPTNVE